MTDPVSHLRKEYGTAELSRSSASDDPIEQFRRWFDDCRRAEVPEPNAMTLCTVGPDGRPSGRMVLLKAFDHNGFTFFTNFESRKARDLSANPYAGLVFWWPVLERQVRIEGTTEQVDGGSADDYFATRPRESQLGAWASSQSRPIRSRVQLEARFRAFEEQFPESVPRPAHWGGYRLKPDRIEFWQGRAGRLHDRLQYSRSGDQWHIERLAP